MTFYSEMAEMATELLTTFGQDIVITRNFVGPIIDPVTGNTRLTALPREHTTKGILKKYPENMIDGSRITVSDRKLILDSSIEPEMKDKITINGQLWPIMEIQTVNPAGTALIYEVRVRR